MKGKMSTSPYSEDLRKRVVEYLKKGKKQKECSEIFGVHRNTISRWWCRYNKEGNYSAKCRLGRKSKIDDVEVELYVKNNPDTKLEMIGRKFGISSWYSAVVLKRLGFSYKKNVHLCGSKRRKTKSIFRLDKGTSVRVSWYILMKVG